MYITLYKALTIILPTKITTAQNEVAFSCRSGRVRGLYYLAHIFTVTIYYISYRTRQKI